MIRTIAACLAAALLAFACTPAQATETAQVTFSGTYAPFPQPFAQDIVPVGKGGPFSSTLDYDSSRSLPELSTRSFTSDFFNYSGNDTTNNQPRSWPLISRTQWFPPGYDPYPKGLRGLVQNSTNRVSPGVYEITFGYGFASVFTEYDDAGRTTRGTGGGGIMLAFTVNLGSDASGYYDLSKLTMTPTGLGLVCHLPGYTDGVDNITSALLILPLHSSPEHPAGASEMYKLTGTATFKGNFWINTTTHSRFNNPPDPCSNQTWTGAEIH